MFGQHIDTAPVLEAFALGGECPLCALRDSTESGYLDQFLGGSVMEPSMRVLVNAKGFCARHFSQLYAANNHLGVALMTHTHLKETISTLEKRWAEPKSGGLFDRFRKKSVEDESHRESHQDSHRQSCALCERLDATMDRYVKTVVWLWKNDLKFRERFNNSQGLCIEHAEAVLASSSDGAMRESLVKMELDNLRRIEKELEWFTLKFDYRNHDKPWGTSKDALPRAIQKLAGINLQIKGD
ncbi:hypothetical protein FACS1894184_07430 [Clostridia bacterium]|nr:hypothetical protein FACS1894184_07430 [Clostridia bacterium]